jgi:serine/threonine protein kinase
VAEALKKIGRYEVLERVGRGGMGALYRGHDPVLDRDVAIKLMHGDFSDDENARPRFFREARAAARLQHRNIVTIFEFAEEDGVPYIVMEFLRGRSLAARMTASPPLTLIEKIDIVDQLCTGLGFAHARGVIHRDVKPANVWLQDDGTVRLLDFGIAILTAATMTRGGESMGSASYMSPEQIEGHTVDGRADTFSAGVVLYELLAGRRPFAGDSPTAVMMQILSAEPRPITEVAPDLPPPLIAAVERALQKSPDKRYARADDFASELRLIRQSLLASDSLVSATSTGLTVPHTPVGRAIGGRASGKRRFLPGDLSTTRGPGIVNAIAPTYDALVARVRELTDGRRWVLPVGGVAIAVVLLGIVMWMTRATHATGPAGPGATVAEARALPAADEGTRARPTSSGAAAPTVPTVKVVTDPPGAFVTLDGRSLGTTPVSIPVQSKGPIRLRVAKPGFMNADVTLSAEQIRAGAATFALTPATQVTLHVEGDYDFEVREGQSVKSAMARRHDIEFVGRHAVRLVAPEYFLDYTLRVDPSEGRVVQRKAPELGLLKVVLQGDLRYCQASLAGQPLLGSSFIERQVAGGSYEIVVECPNGQQQKKSVLIGTDTTATVIFK